MSHVIKNISAVIHLLLCSRYMKNPYCSPRTAWVINVSLVPGRAGLASWLAGRGFGQAGVWLHQGRGLCPAASESTTEQTPLWLSLWKGKRSSLWHAVSTCLRSLLKPAGSFLFWILPEVCESNLPPVGHWVCKRSVVTLARQSSQGLSSGLKSGPSGRSSSACQHCVLYCSFLLFACHQLDREFQRWRENSSQV